MCIVIDVNNYLQKSKFISHLISYLINIKFLDSRERNIFCPTTFHPKVHITLAGNSARIHCYGNKVSGPTLLHYLQINRDNFRNIHKLQLDFCPDLMETENWDLLNLAYVIELCVTKPRLQEGFKLNILSTLIGLKTLRLISFQYLNMRKLNFPSWMNISRLTIEDTKNLVLDEDAFLETPSLRHLGFAQRLKNICTNFVQ